MINIKQLREVNGMTQAQVAAKIGTTQACVAMWESGAAMPRADKLPEIAKVLHCDISDLFGEEE